MRSQCLVVTYRSQISLPRKIAGEFFGQSIALREDLRKIVSFFIFRTFVLCAWQQPNDNIVTKAANIDNRTFIGPDD